jgi:hypothetical protein
VARLIITDDSGVEVARFQQGPAGPLLTFHRDRQALVLGALAVNEMGMAITTDGKPSAEMSCATDGSHLLTLSSHNSTAVASIAVDRERPMVSLRGPESDIGLVAAPGVYVKIREKGRPLFQVPSLDKKILKIQRGSRTGARGTD